jgi:hypothetical protein
MHEVTRVSALVIALSLALGPSTCDHMRLAGAESSASATVEPATQASPTPTPTRVDFATQLKPIFEARCTPCHFAGGKVYNRLPFDRPETITTLGTKLFTRIKDEDERRLIREFLSQQTEHD